MKNPKFYVKFVDLHDYCVYDYYNFILIASLPCWEDVNEFCKCHGCPCREWDDGEGVWVLGKEGM